MKCYPRFKHCKAISLSWYQTDVTPLLMHSSWKTWTSFSCMVNTMVADDVVIQGARSSAAMVLIWFSCYIQVSRSEGWRTILTLRGSVWRVPGHILLCSPLGWPVGCSCSAPCSRCRRDSMTSPGHLRWPPEVHSGNIVRKAYIATCRWISARKT